MTTTVACTARAGRITNHDLRNPTSPVLLSQYMQNDDFDHNDNRQRDIDDIASAAGLDEPNATELYDAGIGLEDI